MMREYNLRSCPFCGSHEVYLNARYGKAGWFGYAKCDVCGAQTGTVSMFCDEQEVSNFTAKEYEVIAAKWNTRADDREVSKRLEKAIADIFNEKEKNNETDEG